MNTQFNQRALDLAVTEYNVLRELGDPVSPAAFGIACAHLQVRLNLSLIHAAEMLRLELDRIATVKLTQAAQTLAESAGSAADEHAVIKQLTEKPSVIADEEKKE